MSSSPAVLSWRSLSLFWLAVLASLIGFVWLFNGILLPFITGFVLAYVLDPLVGKLTRQNLSRGMASLLILLIFLLLAAGLLVLVLPPLIREMTALAMGLPDLVEQLRRMVTELVQSSTAPLGIDFELPDLSALLRQSIGQALALGTGILAGLMNGGGTAAGILSFVALMPVVAFFMMKEWPHMLAQTEALIPRSAAPTFRDLALQIDQRLAAFVRGQLAVCLILALYYAIALSVAGLHYGLLIGLFSGLLSFIPFVGTGLGLIGALVLALLQSGWGEWTLPLTVLGIFAVGQFAEGNFITPRLIGDSVGLHPLWILFALMAGGSLMGLLGIMIAVPVAATLAVILRFSADQYRASLYYHGDTKAPPPNPEGPPHDPSSPPAAP